MAMNELFHVVNLLIFFRSISGFNLDVEKAIVYQGTQGSYYGATTEMVSNPTGKWVLVGAPRQNYSGISKPGAIYKCPVTATSTTGSGCTMLNIRANNSPYPAIQAEENQGLGLNMLVTGQNLVACAPMWKEAVDPSVYYAYGKCSDIPSNGLSQNINKFFNVPQNLRQTGSRLFYLAAEFGFSSAWRSGFSPNRVVMGTPVVGDSIGGYILYQEGAVANFWINERFNIEEGGSLDNLKSTFRSGAYLGYSVGAGFFGQTPSSLVALGAPGFSNKEGTIGAMGLFEGVNPNMRLKKLIAGKTLGSGFGQSMIVADFNKDNRDDIAVGAPMEGEDSMNNLDVGAVYIYYGTGQSTYIDDGQRLRGSGAVMARFGFSVACPGDLNKDGFNDLIVGAPYENNDKGAIYVFNGGSPKIADMYSQRIPASDINSNLRGFGFSLSKSNIDVDANTFVDTSVGSVLSSQTVVLRTRSIASIRAVQTLNPTIMPLNSSGLACRGNSSSFNPCTTVQVCFNYSGDGLSNGIYIDYLLTSDPDTADPMARRFTFYENNGTEGNIINKTDVLVASGSTVCASYQARVTIADRKFFLRVNENPRFDLTYKISSKFMGNEVRPVLDQNKASQTTTSTGQFLTECRPSCKPDLQLAGRALTTLVQVGKTQEAEVQILVVNLGDPAYGASFLLNNSLGIPFTGYTVLLEQGSEQMTCVSERNAVRCTFDKSPLFSQVRGLVNVRFDVSAVKLTEGRGLKNLPAQIDIVAVAEVGSDVDTSNNMEVMKINLQLQATIQMIGSSSPDQVTISETGNGLLILNQAYSIINIGPSPLPAVKVVYTVPVMYNNKIIIEEKNLRIWQLSTKSPSIMCNLTHFPSTGAVTSSPPVVNPSVIITPKSSVPLGCGVSGVACASYECIISEFALDDLQPFIVMGNISQENLPEIPAGYTQIRYYTTATVYPAESLQIPINLNSNISYSAELPIFPAQFIIVNPPLNLVPLIVGLTVGVLIMVLLGVILWKLGFFRRKKREELNAYKRKSYAHQRQSRAAMRASRDLDAGDRQVLSQYSQLN